jgi:hypothetical protein
MRTAHYLTLAAALTLGACSNADEKAEAPPGAMEGFANKQAADEAATTAGKIEATRAREAKRAADARQKVQAAEGMDRFDRTEAALEENASNKAE